MEVLELEDQFGDPQRVDQATALVLFSRDMEGGELLSSALKDKPSEYLPERRAVYVADISRMPGLVARLFALPKMRKRAYPMLLDRKGKTTERLPDQKDHGTLIELDELKIVNVEFLADAGAIEARLEKQKRVETPSP
ncbi:FAD/FMN-containing dehydrogenase [Myxococcota bacterium]|nr:FAD/FMN-containing dehydrogenase [Myxococcota bacterium]